MLHGCVNKRTCPHARMHTQVCSLTQSSSGDWVQSAQPSVMLLLQPPQRREETQLREWTQALSFFFWSKVSCIFFNKFEMHYLWAVTYCTAGLHTAEQCFWLPIHMTQSVFHDYSKVKCCVWTCTGSGPNQQLWAPGQPSSALSREHLLDCLSTCLPFRFASIIQHLEDAEQGCSCV